MEIEYINAPRNLIFKIYATKQFYGLNTVYLPANFWQHG
jgi:hypothetical protein